MNWDQYLASLNLGTYPGGYVDALKHAFHAGRDSVLDHSPDGLVSATPLKPAAASGVVAEVAEEIHGGHGRKFYLRMIAQDWPPVGTKLYAAPTSGGESVDAVLAPRINYGVLHQYASGRGLSYNELCRVVRNALQTAPAQQGAGKDGL